MNRRELKITVALFLDGYATQIAFNEFGVNELNKGGRVPAKYGCQHGGYAI